MHLPSYSLLFDRQANDESGYIGAAIVGSFVALVACWYGAQALYRKAQAKKQHAHDTGSPAAEPMNF